VVDTVDEHRGQERLNSQQARPEIMTLAWLFVGWRRGDSNP
jgi:hypothetical protein